MSTGIRCESCGKALGSEAALGQHARAKHSGDTTRSPPRQRKGKGRKWIWSWGSSLNLNSTFSSLDSSRASSQTSLSSTAGDDRWSPALSEDECQGVLNTIWGMRHSRSTLEKKKFPLMYSASPAPMGPFRKAPVPDKFQPKKAVVALDCEMVQVKPRGAFKSRSECISLTAVDVLTGDILINSLVNPNAPISCWLERLTGVSPDDLRQARRQGKALQGFKGARAELFKHIDSSTILVGHALENDLKVLRVAHDSVVDTQIVAGNAVYVRGNLCSLKTLCKKFVGQEIQKEAHSSLEDTMATREVLLFFARNRTS